MRFAPILFLCSSSLWSLEIELRYELDTSDFFDQPGAKEAMEAVAEFYGDLIIDELEEINVADFQVEGSNLVRGWHPLYLEPDQGGAELEIPGMEDMLVPADTLVIFVGARSMTGSAQGGPGGIDFGNGDFPPFAWLNQLSNRGEEGAVEILPSQQFSTNPSDIAPWGGSIFFNSQLAWNFSTTDAVANGGIDFVSIAMHEIGHVLGIGIFQSSASSWNTLIERDANNFPIFTGPLALATHGAPLFTFDFAHWSDFASVPTLDSPTLAAFGREHGELQPPIMLPSTSTTTATEFSVLTDLDLAALQDIGWEIQAAPENFSVELALGSSTPQISIPTTSGVNYVVNRAAALDALSPEGEVIEGNGRVQIWTDPNVGAPRAFYQVEPQSTAQALPPQTLRQLEPASSENGEPCIPHLPAEQCECCKPES